MYWDLDGTIANTELEAHLPAFNHAFEDFGLDWYWDTANYIDLLKINGGKNRISYFSRMISDPLSDELVIKIHSRKQTHYLNIIKHNGVCLKTGVYRLIKQLHKKKFNLLLFSFKKIDEKNLDLIFDIERGMRIAQIVFQKLPEIEIIESQTLSKTDRDKGGFGSTGLD